MYSKNNSKIIFHVDCDTFYPSVETAFDPSLRNRPVVVLGNNGGNIVSANTLAKKNGFKVGDVYYKIKKDFENIGGVARLPNFTLYGDISNKFKTILLEYSDEIEDYSIDESFVMIDFKEDFDYQKLAFDIRNKIKRYIWIPVSIGIAQTKVLAKIATDLAKKRGGVFQINENNLEEILSEYPVQDIWGIGSKSTLKLKSIGIRNALQLNNAPEAIVRKLLRIDGARIQLELSEEKAIEFLLEKKIRKQIIVAKGFPKTELELEEIERFLSDYILEAVDKLRSDKTTCSEITVFVQTNVFSESPQYYNSISIQLEGSQDSVTKITSESIKGLRKIYRYGYMYKRVGVILTNLVQKNEQQLTLFTDFNPKVDKLSDTVDLINNRFGNGSIITMSSHLKKDKDSLELKTSPKYTSRISDLMIANCK